MKIWFRSAEFWYKLVSLKGFFESYHTIYFLFISLVNEKPGYSRSCHWEQPNAPANSCAIQNYSLPYVETVACNTCIEDGCNYKLINVSEDKVNKNILANHVNNLAMLTYLSYTVFVVCIISTAMRYKHP